MPVRRAFSAAGGPSPVLEHGANESKQKIFPPRRLWWRGGRKAGRFGRLPARRKRPGLRPPSAGKRRGTPLKPLPELQSFPTSQYSEECSTRKSRVMLRQAIARPFQSASSARETRRHTHEMANYCHHGAGFAVNFLPFRVGLAMVLDFSVPLLGRLTGGGSAILMSCPMNFLP